MANIMDIKLFLLWAYLVLPSLCAKIVDWDSDTRRPLPFKSFEAVSTENTQYLIGGKETEPHVYPFQTALDIFKSDQKYFCGGSLVSNTWVLTAAHCVGMYPDYILLNLGAYHFPEASPNLVMKSTHYIAHEAWNNSTRENDIGLVKLPQKVTFNKFIKPIELASAFDRHVGEKAISIGWGMTETQVQSSALLEIITTIIPNDKCKNSVWSYRQMIKPTHICTSGGYTSTCRGDSGGPLLVNTKQVGIISFGVRDCSPTVPSVYTRVSDFTQWISEHTADTEEEEKEEEEEEEKEEEEEEEEEEVTDIWMVLKVFIGSILLLLAAVIIVQNYFIIKLLLKGRNNMDTLL